jgi:hypothetical protein
MTAIQLALAIATPLATVVTAWIKYRHATEVEQWRTRRLALRLQRISSRKSDKGRPHFHSGGNV